MPDSKETRDAQISALREQVAVLRGQRLSRANFVPWKPELFYCMCSVVVSLAASALIGGLMLAPRSIFTILLSLGLLCYAPVPVNHLRVWVSIRRPNRARERKIASLLAQIERLSGGE